MNTSFLNCLSVTPSEHAICFWLGPCLILFTTSHLPMHLEDKPSSFPWQPAGSGTAHASRLTQEVSLSRFNALLSVSVAALTPGSLDIISAQNVFPKSLPQTAPTTALNESGLCSAFGFQLPFYLFKEATPPHPPYQTLVCGPYYSTLLISSTASATSVFLHLIISLFLICVVCPLTRL